MSTFWFTKPWKSWKAALLVNRVCFQEQHRKLGVHYTIQGQWGKVMMSSKSDRKISAVLAQQDFSAVGSRALSLSHTNTHTKTSSHTAKSALSERSGFSSHSAVHASFRDSDQRAWLHATATIAKTEYRHRVCVRVCVTLSFTVTGCITNDT